MSHSAHDDRSLAPLVPAPLAGVHGRERGAAGSIRRARTGFTVVELLAAMLVLATGLLAMSGATAVIARQVNGGAQMMLASSLAQSRFERLRAQPCASVASGAGATRGITETWGAAHTDRGVAIHDTVSFDAGSARRVHVFGSRIACPREDR